MDQNKTKSKMQEATAVVAKDINSIRTGRATPGLVEDIEISAYGGTQKLRVKELASINTQDSSSIVIDPWDKSVIGEIRKGIEAANIGLNPNIDGEVIRISIPPMTAEDREKYAVLVGKKVETGRIFVRQIRAEAMKDIKKAFEDKSITEDQKHSREKALQELTDEFVTSIEEIGQKKEKEIKEI